MTKIEFSGSLEEVKSEIEQAIATYELLGNRSSINFENWFQAWEQGFPQAIENRAIGNYQLSGEKIWRNDSSKRPRWREWSSEGGIITGEYWRDRSIENDSIPLSGTAEQLIQHIVQLEYEGGGQENSRGKTALPPLKGQPHIKLYFRGEQRAKGETSIAIMNRSDDPKSPLQKIDKSDLREYAQRIKNNFATPLFTWQKGRKIISYKNRWQGFDGQWWLCRNETAGRELLTKLLAVLELPLDRAAIRFSEATDEELAFPLNPPEIQVLGQAVPQDNERPLVDVQFWRAEIKLAKLRSPIALVERGAIVYE